MDDAAADAEDGSTSRRRRGSPPRPSTRRPDSGASRRSRQRAAARPRGPRQRRRAAKEQAPRRTTISTTPKDWPNEREDGDRSRRRRRPRPGSVARANRQPRARSPAAGGSTRRLPTGRSRKTRLSEVPTASGGGNLIAHEQQWHQDEAPPARSRSSKVPIATPAATRVATSGTPLISMGRPRSAGAPELRVSEPRTLESVPAQAAAKRLEGQDVLRARRCRGLTLGPKRGRVQRCCRPAGASRGCGRDHARPGGKVSISASFGRPKRRDAGAPAGLARLHDDHGTRPRRGLALTTSASAAIGWRVGGVLLPDLRRGTRNPAFTAFANGIRARSRVHLDRAVRDLDRVEAELVRARSEVADQSAPCQIGDLLERPARHAVDAVGGDGPLPSP